MEYLAHIVSELKPSLVISAGIVFVHLSHRFMKPKTVMALLTAVLM